MRRTTKKVQGKLLDKSSKLLLSNCSVTITLIDAQNSDNRKKFEVFLTVDGYKPELDNKTHLLRLDDDLSGEVFISISTSELPGIKTHFKVFLQDNVWGNLEWFMKI
ncbi:MAG: hypothetical protein A2X25_09735 [Chloroflexi bacterium GWB2_49_20]|nr:MAG: hypothetical protein A2X25_09735 [Chloroflexi bacterium GWB2_49_20]OGN79296.1 MAG: hypothetical protein A2X26_04290 [Chloroflexi bacterium GWC2_49_37]OGN82934.1 MAG: hypothetical protein A2X27_08405 [Chloroflexi bacterium GWD2_49_16]HCC78587.1 hypothetical protein [Anaerolineae bacterium]